MTNEKMFLLYDLLNEFGKEHYHQSDSINKPLSKRTEDDIRVWEEYKTLVRMKCIITDKTITK